MVEFTITEEVQVALNTAFGKMVTKEATKEEYDKFVKEISIELDYQYACLELDGKKVEYDKDGRWVGLKKYD